LVKNHLADRHFVDTDTFKKKIVGQLTVGFVILPTSFFSHSVRVDKMPVSQIVFDQKTHNRSNMLMMAEASV